MSADLRPKHVYVWTCPGCLETAWGCAEQRDYWHEIHQCKGVRMTTIAEKIEAAKAKLAKEQEKLAELERRAAEGPKRRGERDITEIRELMLVEAQFKKRYGVGFSGAAEVTRKARAEGIEPVVATGQVPPDSAQVEPDPSVPDPPQGEEPTEAVAPAAPTEAAAPPPEPEFDPEDEPPVPNPPEVVAAQEEDEVPW